MIDRYSTIVRFLHMLYNILIVAKVSLLIFEILENITARFAVSDNWFCIPENLPVCHGETFWFQGHSRGSPIFTFSDSEDLEMCDLSDDIPMTLQYLVPRLLDNAR